jgi:hypothetical protein
MKNINILSIMLFTLFLMTGCALQLDTTYMGSQNEQIPATKEKAFNDKLEQVASVVKNDLKYKKINLDTEEAKDWFKKLSYKLWDKQITKTQFIQAGVIRYPSNYYEFDLVAHWLLK